VGEEIIACPGADAWGRRMGMEQTMTGASVEEQLAIALVLVEEMQGQIVRAREMVVEAEAQFAQARKRVEFLQWRMSGNG
jgi:uncharacterized protein YqfA (UPF0365 family)